nr:MAG TPA: hypothetical protein [Caudoviricetes sp.]
MDTNNEILDAIEILADKKIGENITKVLTGICKSVNINNNTCVMDSNGVSGTVQFYGGPPEVNELYRIFVPSNNMSRAFVIVPPQFTVNPNLLDNWYFGRPVDQRGGYVVYAGANLYSDASCTTIAGQVAGGPYAARAISAICVSFTSNATYYCKIGDTGVVRGYMSNGYAVDRWRIGDGANGTMLLTGSGLKLTRTDGVMYLDQRIPKTQIPEGSALTYSVLTTSGLFSISFVIKNDTYHEQNVGGGISLGWNYTPAELVDFTLVNNTVNSDVTILAAKLELGSPQTLAHLENGNWVLNEIPDYGEQLRRCQRYCRVYRAGEYLPCIAFALEDGWYCIAMLPYELRALPSTNIGSNISVTLEPVLGGQGVDTILENYGTLNGVQILKFSKAGQAFKSSNYFRVKLNADFILTADL